MGEERALIAADLHDDLGARLTELSLLGSLGVRTALLPERARSCLGEISLKSNEMVTALDEIVWTVNPKNDSVSSVVNYFCHYAQRFFEPTPIRCRLDVARDLPQSPLNSEQRHHMFLAFKEALNNVARHSAASEIWLRVSAREGALRVTVEDNGRGFAGEPAASEADGLANMRARLARSGGACEVRSAVGHGTTVEFTLPLAGRADVGTGDAKLLF
jgi:signal transduction histidine kinase